MKGYNFQVKNNLLDAKHVKRMGISVWLYMWLLDKMTSISEEGVGKVLGGKPVKLEDVQPELGIAERTYRRWVKQLEKHQYITVLHAPYGIVFTVNKAHKSFGRRSAKSGTPDRPYVAHLPATSGTPNKTSTVDKSSKTGAAQNAAEAGKPFSPTETRQVWFDGDKEDFQLLAWFFDQKGLWLKFDSREKVTHATQRHIRAARRIAAGGWSQRECEGALSQLRRNEKLQAEWTLETLEKYLTK